ncbi:hypothetical protein ATN37_00995 [Rhodococcus sp. MH15]|uniref:hypothetical protein n=1 Tax=Rhodococcus sp. MH15 TaxID=1761014 RepID=UPI001C500021|nr:hypothetical protein [Rhodococcus sp. MH15]MBW0288608.1 hypothetical protein [Rhodococcus sp. MH15]
MTRYPASVRVPTVSKSGGGEPSLNCKSSTTASIRTPYVCSIAQKLCRAQVSSGDRDRRCGSRASGDEAFVHYVVVVDQCDSDVGQIDAVIESVLSCGQLALG